VALNKIAIIDPCSVRVPAYQPHNIHAYLFYSEMAF